MNYLSIDLLEPFVLFGIMFCIKAKQKFFRLIICKFSDDFKKHKFFENLKYIFGEKFNFTLISKTKKRKTSEITEKKSCFSVFCLNKK